MGRLAGMDRQTEFVLRSMEERGIRFVRLWFTDVLGSLKSVAITPAEVEGAIAEGVGFDGSAIEGFARVFESDMVAHPDPSTYQVLPWRQEGRATARMLCDIKLPDGSPSYADPRFVLKRAMRRAADMGFTFYIHPEIEFYLLRSLTPPVPRVKPEAGVPGWPLVPGPPTGECGQHGVSLDDSRRRGLCLGSSERGGHAMIISSSYEQK